MMAEFINKSKLMILDESGKKGGGGSPKGQKMIKEIAASEFTKTFFQKIAGAAFDKLFSENKRLSIFNRKDYERHFEYYISNLLERYSHVKTIINSEIQLDLRDYYVPLNFSANSQVFSSDSIVNLLSLGNRIVLSGTAGSGKSTLMKWTLLKIIDSKKWGFPLFFELRNLNTSKTGLIQGILNYLSKAGLDLEDEDLHKLLLSGRFVVFFDGFDEVHPEYIDSAENELTELVNKFPTTKFIVSSRPDERFISWSNFCEAQLMPMNQEQGANLVSRIPCNKTLKKKFLHAFEKRLYKRYLDFAQNPLLLTIMLLTYEQYSGIPAKIFLFYKVAFDTLFFKHDSSKGQYKRTFCSGLKYDEFESLLAAFSISSWHSGHISFSESELKLHLKKSKNLTGIVFEIENFIKDLLKSVCVLTKDGLRYNYSHRTFQEYFAALFLVRSSPEIKHKIIGSMITEVGARNLIKLFSEMDQEFFQSEIELPILNDFSKKLSSSRNSLSAVCGICDRIIINDATRKVPLYFNIPDKNAKEMIGLFSIWGRKYYSEIVKLGKGKTFLKAIEKGLQKEIIFSELPKYNKLVEYDAFERIDLDIKYDVLNRIKEIKSKMRKRRSCLAEILNH